MPPEQHVSNPPASPSRGSARLHTSGLSTSSRGTCREQPGWCGQPLISCRPTKPGCTAVSFCCCATASAWATWPSLRNCTKPLPPALLSGAPHPSPHQQALAAGVGQVFLGRHVSLRDARPAHLLRRRRPLVPAGRASRAGEAPRSDLVAGTCWSCMLTPGPLRRRLAVALGCSAQCTRRLAPHVRAPQAVGASRLSSRPKRSGTHHAPFNTT